MPPEILNTGSTNGWSEYKQRVFYQLDELTKSVDKMDTKLTTSMEKIEEKLNVVREDVIVLKTKSVLFGLLGGAIITAAFELALKFVH